MVTGPQTKPLMLDNNSTMKTAPFPNDFRADRSAYLFGAKIYDEKQIALPSKRNHKPKMDEMSISAWRAWPKRDKMGVRRLRHLLKIFEH